jgi:sulfur carrier protein
MVAKNAFRTARCGDQGVTVVETSMATGTRVRIIVNGEATDTGARTLAELVAGLGFAEGAVATAQNGDFVPKGARAAAELADGDRIEIVAPRQGG